MPIEPAALSAVASASNALITLFKYGFHYAEIPAEVQQFRLAIENLDNSINTTKRLRRVKSHYLDNVTKTEVDETIQVSESVLESISRTIEGCRVDLQTKGTVTVKKRLDWILRGHEAFMSRGMTLNSCLQCLTMQIGRMDALQPPVPTSLDPNDDLPSYRDSLSPAGHGIRAPSMRKPRPSPTPTPTPAVKRRPLSSRQSFSNASTFSFSTEKESLFTSPNLRPLSADTASVFSYEEEADMELAPSANFSVVPDLSCPGDYCTLEHCTSHNHTFSQQKITLTVSLDRGFEQHGWQPARNGTTTSTISQQSSTRRRHRSGLI